jgi:release factor glutamine methyltransferase
MYEPELALFTQDKGLFIIKKIISESKKYLTDEGILLLEIGEDQKDEIIKLGAEYGFDVSVLSDYSGLPRVAICKRLEA